MMLNDRKPTDKLTNKMPNIKELIQLVIRGILPAGNINAQDVDLVTRLCMMAAVPTGEENPRELLREMSNAVVSAFAVNIEKVQKNPMSAPVAQLFFMEWCFRNEYLNDDWKWEWDSESEGHVSYNPKEPLDKLLLKIKTAC